MKYFSIFFIFFTLVLFSCATQKNNAESMSAEQLIQNGQNMYALGQYSSAAYYYQMAIERFGDDPRTYIESRYELGQVFLKQKKYDLAYAAFTEIEELYESSAAGALPPAFQKLAKIGLAKIPEKKLPKK